MSEYQRPKIEQRVFFDEGGPSASGNELSGL